MNRKLQAVGYEDFANFNINKPEQVSEMVIWLEDQVIRHYTVQDRVKLRNNTKVDRWFQAELSEYLNDLGCPLAPNQRSETPIVIDWLLSLAVRLVYADNLPKYQTVEPPSAESDQVHAQSAGDNPLDNVNFKDSAVKQGIKSIARLLDVPPHTNPDMLFKAICLLAKNNLTNEKIKEFAAKPKDSANKNVPLKDVDLGFATGDYALDDAAKVLRLLHIHNLRHLQSQINEAIVEVQKVTADPKTDQRLGKVGR